LILRSATKYDWCCCRVLRPLPALYYIPPVTHTSQSFNVLCLNNTRKWLTAQTVECLFSWLVARWSCPNSISYIYSHAPVFKMIIYNMLHYKAILHLLVYILLHSDCCLFGLICIVICLVP
jgi:hypothetical protein